MGLLDYIVKPAEAVVNAFEQSKTHTKTNGKVSQATNIAAQGGNPLSVLQTKAPQEQPAPSQVKPNPTPANVQPDFSGSQSANPSTMPLPKIAMNNEQNSVNTANKVADSPGGRFVQGVSTGASPNYDPTAYEQQKGANSPEEYGAIAGSALPALGMADNPLQGMDMALPAINQAKGATTAAIDETKANVVANGGAEAGFLGFGKGAKEEPTTQTGNPVKLKNSDIYKQYGVKTPARKAEIQKTLDNEVFGSTPPEVFDNLQSTIEDLGSKIDEATVGNPSTASKTDPNGVTYQGMADGMRAKAQAKGLMKTPEGEKAVNKAIAQQINHISQNADAINNGSATTSFSTPVFNDDLTPATIKGNPSTDQTQYRRVGGAPAGTKGPKGPFREMPVKNGEAPDLSAQPSSTYNPKQMASANEADIAKAQKPLDMPTLRSEYKAANADNAALLRRRNSVNARPLTDAEEAQLLYRDVLKDKIGATNPQVMDLISKQHDLYDASDGVLRASNEYEKAQEAAQQETTQQTGKGMSGRTKLGIGAATLPIDLAALHYAGINPGQAALSIGAGVYDTGKKLINGFMNGNKKPTDNGNINNSPNNQSENVTGHGSIMTPFVTNVNSMSQLPSSPDQIQENTDGTSGISNVYTWKDANGKQLFADANQIKSGNDRLAAIQGDPSYNSNVQLQAQARQLTTQIANETQFSKPINDAFPKYKTANALYNTAIVDAQKANLDISNYNGSYNDLLNQIQPKNAKLAQDLQNLKLQGILGDQISFTGTLTDALKQANKAKLINYYNIIGGQNPTAIGTGTTTQVPTSQGVNTTTPVTHAAPPSNFNFGTQGGGNMQSNMNAAMSLPHIQ